MEKKEIRICSNHSEYPTPLIGTFAFMGAEFWCPFCEATGGVFGMGEFVEETPELIKRKKLFVAASKEYLDACATLASSSLMWEGKRIKPSELPKAEMDRCLKIYNENFKYRDREIEEFEHEIIKENDTTTP